jgi:ribosomal protein S18 acetylase RimI-like enzyme
MIVRTATARDIPEIVRLIRQLAAHDHVTPPDSDTLAEVLGVLMARSTVYIVAEASDGNALVGAMQLDFRLTTWEAAPYAYVEDFIVDEAYRGQGIGSAMLALAEELSRERGCVRMDLDVLQESVDSQRFYARHGFVDQQRLYLRRVLRCRDRAIAFNSDRTEA